MRLSRTRKCVRPALNEAVQLEGYTGTEIKHWHTLIYIHTCIYIRMYLHTHIHIHTYIHTYIHTHTHIYIYMHTHGTYLHIYTQTCMHTYTHIYT